MGTSNSKLPRVIIWEGGSSSHIIFITLFSSRCTSFQSCAFFTNLSKLMSTFEGAKKPISWAKPACFHFSFVSFQCAGSHSEHWWGCSNGIVRKSWVQARLHTTHPDLRILDLVIFYSMCRLHAFERASDPTKLGVKCGMSCHMHLKEHPTLRRSLGQNVEYLVSDDYVGYTV